MSNYIDKVLNGKHKVLKLVILALSLIMAICFAWSSLYVITNYEPIINIVAMLIGLSVPIIIIVSINKQKIIFLIVSLLIVSIFIASFVTLVAITLPSLNNQGTNEKSVVIVLGAHTNGYEPGDSLKSRLDRTYDYLLTHEESVCIVTGGQGANESVPEAVAMQNYLTKLGISKDRIYMDDKSTNTEENLINALEIIKDNKLDDHPVIIVTNTFHTFRAMLLSQSIDGYEQLSIECIGAHDLLKYWVSNYTREICAIGKFFIKSLING